VHFVEYPMADRDTALVIIDVQNAILRGLGGTRAQDTERAFEAVVARIAGLLARAWAALVPVIVVQHDGAPGHRLAAGSEGWLIRPELARHAGEPVVHKRSCDSFFETDLADRLIARGISPGTGRLVVAGCMTQYCVDTTCRRAVSLGYDVTLAADGHMTADSGALTFEQIIAHHNAVLDGFDAGVSAITVTPAAKIMF
jgi:nicotinamidase-related amidase